MARVAAGGQLADPQLEFIPVRADQADAAVKLGHPRRGQRLAQPVLQLRQAGPRLVLPAERLAVSHSRGTILPGDGRVCLGHQRPDRGHQLQPAGGQLRAHPDQLVIPGVERTRRAAAPRPGRLQQGGALPQHPLVVGPGARVPGAIRLSRNHAVVRCT